MNFVDAVKTCFAKYTTFTGRAARPEFWYFALFSLLVQIAIAIVTGGAGTLNNALSALFALGMLLPSLAVGARRLHDIDRTGWWQLIALIPIIGIIVLIVFWCLRGNDGPNRFGA
ncbi:MAG: DUF805 domain-containing protein [Xanthobacteraceae bacterium]|nr:MAG: DUF805 domain-containing protein [Xanthobacteraceae bacterium]